MKVPAFAIGFQRLARDLIGPVGIACHVTWGVTYVAQVVEVAVDPDGDVHVQRVVCAVDCGLAINPNGVAAQMEGVG